ncbi:NAD-dependent dihydropyrimidine dehydrogenase subunit PreA [Aquisphaera giovannonii]|uniref:NAD-dependent dihydropyrimidine dehydrogenase subunit PreA n=1 Tax=Aquisphaera giovannonii TaxID=406548 RepID=A0A5B9VZP1_9BACT|nr:dihydroorotate dehydrogenase-like protein [Aquisphaera giovannonii]QEH33896.1 NAD-dependent dihydropyrimidine dehydrogenase subunit PreA [Aquisphaera giovannonii]
MSPSIRTKYLGLDLKNPLVASAGPLTGKIDSLMKLEEAGASAVVLPSLFEEQITREEVEIALLYDFNNEGFAEAQTYLPEMQDYHTGPDNYLQLVRQAKQALTVPVIGSLNGTTNGGWIHYGRMIEQAGADALELNIYFLPTEPETTALEVENRYLELVSAVREAVSIPLAVKVGPFFSSMPNMAKRLYQSGADGLVLFNRFLQPDIDLETLSVEPHLVLSSSDELRLPLRWIAILRSYFEKSLAATSGVHAAEDVIKLLLAGADVAMTTSGVLRKGPGLLSEMLVGLRTWLEEKEYVSVEQMKGSLSQRNSPDPAAFERANYVKAIRSYTSQFAG